MFIYVIRKLLGKGNSRWLKGNTLSVFLKNTKVFYIVRNYMDGSQPL